jgi:hypothetical protein
MNAESGLELPQGTSVYCCPRGLVLDLSWQSRLGMHIVRVELPLSLCEPEQRAALEAAARDFRRTVAEEGFRPPGHLER